MVKTVIFYSILVYNFTDLSETGKAFLCAIATFDFSRFYSA